MEISCIVVAGGKGSRLGHKKAQTIVGKKSLLQRVLDSLVSFGSEIIVVTSEKESFPLLTNYPKHRVVSDIYSGKGPLGGIFTGLTVSHSLFNIVVACDMPFLNQGLLSYMTQLAPSFDLVIPRLGNMVEPLHAVYSRNCLSVIEQMIKQDNLSVYRLLSLVKVRYVNNDEIDRFDPEHLSFFNINTQADLKRARELARREENTNANC